jgi:hypothetical protein
MRTGAKGFAIGAAVLAVAITACVDATAYTSPTETALYEGAAVSMAPENIQVSGIINGKVVSSAVHQWAIDGIVTNGIAQAKSQPGQLVDSKTMPALMVTDNHPFAHGRPNERLFTSTKDKAGNTHDFAFLGGKSDGPTASIIHLENGKIAESYSYDWQKVRGGWVAKGFAVTVFKDGKPTVTVRSGTKLAPSGGVSKMFVADDPCMFDAQYAALSGSCYTSQTFGGGGGGGYSGGNYWPDGSGTPCSCANELAAYLAAAWAVGMATSDALATAVTPYYWAAVGGAWAYVGFLLYQYNQCATRCRALNSGWGGGGSSWTLIAAGNGSPYIKSSP